MINFKDDQNFYRWENWYSELIVKGGVLHITNNKPIYHFAGDGILAVEVPLLFYFDPEKKKSKSFINQVRTRPDGTKALEILVNVGAEVMNAPKIFVCCVDF